MLQVLPGGRTPTPLLNVQQSRKSPDSQQLFLPPAGSRNCADITIWVLPRQALLRAPQRQHLQVKMRVLPCTVAPWHACCVHGCLCMRCLDAKDIWSLAWRAHHCPPLLRNTLVHPGRGHHPDVHASLRMHKQLSSLQGIWARSNSRNGSRMCGPSVTLTQALAKRHILTPNMHRGQIMVAHLCARCCGYHT